MSIVAQIVYSDGSEAIGANPTTWPFVSYRPRERCDRISITLTNKSSDKG